MPPAIARLSLDLWLEITDHLQEFDTGSGERWPTLLPRSKHDILKARSVCRGFRDALWLAYSNVLAERGFYLIESDLNILHKVARHPILQRLTKTITFGGECFSKEGLDLFDHIIDAHPTSLLGTSGHTDDAWMLGLAHMVDSNLSQVEKARVCYKEQLEAQKVMWESGHTLMSLKLCLEALPRLQSVRLRPRQPRKSPYKASGPTAASRCDALSNSLLPTSQREWKDLRRVVESLPSFENIIDFRLSSLSNIGLPRLSPSIFRQLRTAKFTIDEKELCRDGQYLVEPPGFPRSPGRHSFSGSSDFPGLQECLETAPRLTTLDITFKYPNQVNYRSKILADMAATPSPPYKLQHLVLERAIISEEDLTSLLKPHLPTLRSLILIFPWIRPGNWSSFLETLREDCVCLEYLELYKPSQCGTSYYENMDWIDTKLLKTVAKEWKLVQFSGAFDDITGKWLEGSETWAETWDNPYPREGRR